MRLFIAFPIPEQVQQYIDEKLTRPLRRSKAKVSWVKAENLHITVKFLGETERVDDIVRALKRGAAGHRIVKTALGATGTFGGRSPKVIWVRPEGGESTLSQIVEEVDDNLVDFGFSKESRKWTPHITIGRIRKQDDNLIGTLNGIQFEKMTFIIDRIVLMKSTLTPGGAVYNIIHEEYLKT